MRGHLSPLFILLLILRPTNINQVAYIFIGTYFVFVHSLSSTAVRFCSPQQGPTSLMRSHKTRSTRWKYPTHLANVSFDESSISQLTFFFFIMFKKNNSSQQELLLSCCFFDRVSSIIRKLWLRLCYFRVSFHQLPSPPEFQVTHMPKGNFVYI